MAEEKSSVVGIQIDGLGYACIKIAKNHLSYVNFEKL